MNLTINFSHVLLKFEHVQQIIIERRKTSDRCQLVYLVRRWFCRRNHLGLYLSLIIICYFRKTIFVISLRGIALSILIFLI